MPDSATITEPRQRPGPALRPPLLAVEGLRTHLFLKRGVVRALDGVSFEVGEGETLGLVGESGSGKTMTCLSLMRLLPQPAGRIVAGRVLLDGTDLVQISQGEMAANYRGSRIAMISQDPLTSLNPVFSVGDQVAAPFRYHGLRRGRAALRNAVANVLSRVKIPSPERRLRDFPHQFSGGMRQRVLAAMAIAAEPRLLIADEPTSNLDVTIQVQMIRLLKEIQGQTGVGLILITHDLGVAAGICQRVAVMYAGRIVEIGTVREIYAKPRHPYTQALLNAIPHLGRKRKRLLAIEGQPPDLLHPLPGCAFAPRCPEALAVCSQEYPPRTDTGHGSYVHCWLNQR